MYDKNNERRDVSFLFSCEPFPLCDQIYLGRLNPLSTVKRIDAPVVTSALNTFNLCLTTIYQRVSAGRWAEGGGDSGGAGGIGVGVTGTA